MTDGRCGYIEMPDAATLQIAGVACELQRKLLQEVFDGVAGVYEPGGVSHVVSATRKLDQF